ncbi:MAG: TolC family protein [Desulfomonile tiedjei]|uniref:TolC family protein n=1 Tax=Desulfomonile tiedjei TaxID=2358 RepID=A0A9D6Z3Y5_9BACT|nr:TolC family protein [Desulfomonile tiedjei]
MSCVRSSRRRTACGLSSKLIGQAVHKESGSGSSRDGFLSRVLLMAALCLTLTSCSTDWSFVRQQNASMVMSVYRARPLETVNGGKTVLTVHDCTRLALANSLDLQAVIWEERVRGRLAQASQLKMMPRMDGFYALSQRDRPSWSRSDVINQEGAWEVVGPGPATGVTNFSTGRERGWRNWNVQAAWSPMDALMAKYLHNIKSNEALYTSYQRVRVSQQLIGTVVSAFYRLLALNNALPKAQALETHRRDIVRDLEGLYKNAYVDSQEYLTAQNLFSEAKSLLSGIYVDVDKQRELLCAALNVSPCSYLKLDGFLAAPPTEMLDSCKLEAAALVNRPECYQADLTFANSVADTKRLMVKFFPRVDGFVGYFRDENKFFLNKNWIDGGMRITWDLMDVCANFLEHEAATDRIAKTDQDRAAISMGILTQVKLKTLDSIKSVERFKKMTELREQVKEAYRISTDVETAKMRGAPQSLIRITREKAECNRLQAEIDALLALGEVHAAIADLEASAGINYPVNTAIPQQVPSVLTQASNAPATAFKKAGNIARRLLPW